MEFKRTRPQEELDQETVITAHSEDGVFSWVPKDPANRYYAEFLRMEAEGYEAWWHDEEVDWSQSWDKIKDLPLAQEDAQDAVSQEPVNEPVPKKTRRKKTTT